MPSLSRHEAAICLPCKSRHRLFNDIESVHCRDQWSFEKKIKKARAKKNRSVADSLTQRRPSYRIDHLVKERYNLPPAHQFVVNFWY